MRYEKKATANAPTETASEARDTRLDVRLVSIEVKITMAKQLTIQDLEKKKDFHEKRFKYYQKRIEEKEKIERRIGFKLP